MADGRIKLCGARYERPGGAERGDRIVRCSLPADHRDQNHQEEDTGAAWPAAQLVVPYQLRPRLRVGRHHGVTIVEYVGDGDRGYLVGTVIPGAYLPVEAALALAQEICDAVNATRRTAANVVVPHSKQEWS